MTNYQHMSGSVLRNLRRVHDAATPDQRNEGLRWYTTAHRRAASLAGHYKLSTQCVAGVIAALSPGLEWERNVEAAKKVIKAHVAGEALPLVGAYGWNNIRKCERILKGADPLQVFSAPTANKTRAFFTAVSNPHSYALVIDRHAASAAFNRRGAKGGSAIENVPPALYRWLEARYRIAAQRAGVTPLQFQAVIWCAWRSQ